MKEGRLRKLGCRNCGNEFELFVNDIYAHKSKLSVFVAGFVFLIGTPLVLYFLKDILLKLRGPYIILVVAGFILVPSIVYIILVKDDEKRVSAFNRLKVKGEN